MTVNATASLPMHGKPPIGTLSDSDSEAIYRRITFRLIPFLFLCYLLNIVDRVNIGFAQLQMKTSLGLSDAAYGLGATVFFIGYVLFEVPSNLLLKRIGARATIMRIMVLWGLASACMMFVKTPGQFYVGRFLLGVFEAGFFPGIVLYLTFWYPPHRRTQAMAIFMTAMVASAFVTNPVSGWILKNMHGVYGLEGWQWMFLLEGLPTVPVGILAYFVLPNGPKQARWLSPAEQDWVHHAAAGGNTEAIADHRVLRDIVFDPRVYLLALGGFTAVTSTYFLAFWLPTIIKELGVSDVMQIGLYGMVPAVFALVAMVLYGRLADGHSEQRWYYGLVYMVAGPAFLGTALAMAAGNLILTLVAISVAASAVYAAFPVFWAMATRYLGLAKAAAGIAFINTLQNLSGLSPAVVGAIKSHTGSLTPVLYILSGMFVVVGAAVVVGMRNASPGAATAAH